MILQTIRIIRASIIKQIKISDSYCNQIDNNTITFNKLKYESINLPHENSSNSYEVKVSLAVSTYKAILVLRVYWSEFELTHPNLSNLSKLLLGTMCVHNGKICSSNKSMPTNHEPLSTTCPYARGKFSEVLPSHILLAYILNTHIYHYSIHLYFR